MMEREYYEQAKRELEKLVKKHPSDVEAWRNLAAERQINGRR